MVFGVAGMRFSASAQPKASSQMICPTRATATAMEGRCRSLNCCLMNSRTRSKAAAGSLRWRADAAVIIAANSAKASAILLIGFVLLDSHCHAAPPQGDEFPVPEEIGSLSHNFRLERPFLSGHIARSLLLELLGAKRDHRVDARGARSGNPGRQERGGAE